MTTLFIVDKTSKCSDGRLKWLSRVEKIVIHRISLSAIGIQDKELDGVSMCRAFRNPEKLGGYTGNQNPYSILVRSPEGVIEQCTPLLETTAHARAWNSSSIGVAVVGDFRKNKPDMRQWSRTKLLSAALSACFEAEIVGHDELPGGSSDKAKSCPGENWPMERFRTEVSQLIESNREILGNKRLARKVLAKANCVFGG